MAGVLIAQLWRLQHHPNPDRVFGYYIVSVPLAAILQVAALCTALIGGIRFWRQQTAMARGKVHSGGWELMSIGCGAAAVSHADRAFLLSKTLMRMSWTQLLIGLFAVHVGIDIHKT
jgi:hypothetical protein